MATLSQGTSFTFSSQSYTVTRVTVQRSSTANQNRQRVSTAHLGSDADKEEPYLEIWQPPADETNGNTIEVDFIGGTIPTAGASGAISISGGIAYASSAATCVSSTVTAAVGDIVKGSASFRIPTT